MVKVRLSSVKNETRLNEKSEDPTLFIQVVSGEHLSLLHVDR